jgi:hypothetical protein
MEYPTNQTDKLRAARDPLTPAGFLHRFYAEDSVELNRSLAMNFSLPSDIIEDMIVHGTSAWLFLNPLLTFAQVQKIVRKKFWNTSRELKKCKTVIEMFDLLICTEDWDFSSIRSEPLSLLLRSPLVGTEEFRERAELYEKRLFHMIIFADARYDVNSMDITLVEDLEDFEGICQNINASTSLLTEVITFLKNSKVDFSSAVYDNPQYPVPLAAAYLLATIDFHKWSPSSLQNFEPRLDQYINTVFGEGPWKDLPLMWKLKAIVE